MSDLPLSTGQFQGGGVVDSSSPTESTVPAWLTARRAKAPVADEEVTFAAVPESEIEEASTVAEAGSANGASKSPSEIFGAKSALQTSPVKETGQADAGLKGPPPLPKSKVSNAKNADGQVRIEAEKDPEPEDKSFKGTLLNLCKGGLATGVGVSLLVHTIALSILALLVIGGPTTHRALEIFGIQGDPDEALTDIDLDSAMSLEEPGKDAAALQFPDVTELAASESAAFDPGSSIRGVPNAKGKGAGEGGGGGEGMAVGALNIPKYAVTKGSFSAWTEPKDPEPRMTYQIIIQFRLPADVKTYRGTDLSGMITGTDDYRQAIKLGRGEVIPVTNGNVQIRITVPGGDRMVRDTIRVESKLLHEKQTLEIEF